MRNAWWRGWGRWTGVLLDVTLATGMTLVMVSASLQSGDQPARPMDAWSVAAIALVGAWTGLARHAPRTSVVGAAVSLYLALSIGVAAFSPALALGVPLFVAAWTGHLWWAVTVTGLVAVSGTTYRLLSGDGEPVAQIGLTTLFDVSLMAAVLLLGEALRSRRALREEATLRLRLAEQEHRRRLTAERMRTARDLHDVLSHTLALVGIQANVAAENLDTAPERARQALENVRRATRDAMSDLRSTIAVLREETGPDGDPAPAPGLAQLPELVESVRNAGLAATLTHTGEPTRLRPAVELAAYRVVQESLTNTLRHADAASVTVVVAHEPGGVRVSVRDDGRGHARRPAVDGGAGSGLRGMAERVRALGGTLTSGPAPTGGFQVEAWLPAGGEGT
ncbi:MAG: sensor histidine kinase [Micromonosporaceae bacterium]